MTTDDSLDELAAEYVLGTLDTQQRLQVQQRLSQDPALARAIDAWEARLLPLAALVPPKIPSAALWQRITHSIDPKAVTRLTAQPTRLRRWLESIAFWRGLSAVGFSAAVLMAVLLLMTPTAPQYLVVLAAPQSQTPGWLVRASAQDMVELVPLLTVQVPAGQTLQFWTKADDWKAPVSLGLVKPGQSLRIPLDQLPPLQANQLFELTLEQEGGSPTGLPTGPIQFIGRTVQVAM